MVDVIWLAGPFGAGKTTVARLLAEKESMTLVDPEVIGEWLVPVLAACRPVRDFQDWPAWRVLVGTYLAEIHAELGGTLVVPQTVLVESYWDELMASLHSQGMTVCAVTLHVDEPEHRRRISQDSVEVAAREWREQRAIDYRDAASWLHGRTSVIDTTEMSPRAVADRVDELTAM